MKIYTFLCFIIILPFTVVYSCDSDYQCGVGYPFAVCNGKLNFYPGIDYDDNFNLLIAGKYNSSHNGPYGVPAMFRVPIVNNNGFGGEIHKFFNINGEIEEGAGANHIFKFLAFVPKADYYYYIMNQAGTPVFSILKGGQGDNTITPVFNIHNTPFVIDFARYLVDADLSVYGAYGIYKFNKLPTVKADAESSILLYQNQIVNGIALDQRNSKDIYMSTYDGNILKGSVDCLNCTQDKLIKIGSDSDIGKLTDFIMVRDLIYYSFNGGIKKFPVDGSSGPIQIVSNENVLSLTEFNGIVYFQTNDGSIKSVLSTSGNYQNYLYNSTSDHLCQPAVGFNNLDGKCPNGLILWDSKGIPRCTSFKSGTTIPEICYNQYDCGPSGYFACLNGGCSCLPNFYGTDCKSCDGKVQHNSNGTPVCIIN
ncbi:hypothetical protein CYY_000107 [Polysphondylium violaceum]|uniref:EGF-like domain-containing protein n=1 Tax=Polysphondylium violaceum TaxID=133409 RepID=A0A8J4Q4K4_9MYCE|nr:hypothetical protein CYY_000107 [Polysphondylium violaceum]